MKRILILAMVFFLMLPMTAAFASVEIPIGNFSDGLAWMKKSGLYRHSDG